MMENNFSPEIVDYFAKTPLDPLFLVPEVLDSIENPMKSRLEKELDKIKVSELENILIDTKFQFLNRDTHRNKLIDEAKIWCIIEKLQKVIPQKKLTTLFSQDSQSRPAPYNHNALLDLTITDDYLVPLSEFSIIGDELHRNGYIFKIMPIREQSNSSYWLEDALIKLGIHKDTFVRLDPFLFGKKNVYQSMKFKMHIYGRKLNWHYIVNLSEPDFGQYLAKESDSSHTTDYVWNPRDNEIHFTCEEIPKSAFIDIRGSRYFHAIYSKKEDLIIHLDGAIRIYTRDEISIRTESHVRNSGKIGTRVKIFRIDKSIDKEVMATLCINYFVWNDDIIEYLNRLTPAT